MYLNHCKTLEELKKEYRRLTKKLHPDCGGTDEEMKALNAEFEKFFAILKDKHNATADEAHKTTETAADFMHVVEALLNLDGITVEICGSWLWISGNTYRHKTALKEAGCKWASAKKLWYWRSEDKAATSHKSVSMERIREKYGSEIHVSTAAQRPALA